jgi:transposase
VKGVAALMPGREALLMMGTKERSFAPLIHVSVEELVPQDHFYRHLERTLDLSFVRGFVQETYACKGRPSIDPVVFFKLQLVMFFEDIRSERLLMRHAADRLSVLWYLSLLKKCEKDSSFVVFVVFFRYTLNGSIDLRTFCFLRRPFRISIVAQTSLLERSEKCRQNKVTYHCLTTRLHKSCSNPQFQRD